MLQNYPLSEIINDNSLYGTGKYTHSLPLVAHVILTKNDLYVTQWYTRKGYKI